MYFLETIVQTVYCGTTPNGAHYLSDGVEMEVVLNWFLFFGFVNTKHDWLLIF